MANMDTATGNPRLWLVASAVAATLCVLTAVPASAGPYDWAAGLPGCHPTQPAVAHNANGVLLAPQPTTGPVPCGMLTGWATIENRIAVTNDNTVIFMPALLPGQPAQLPPGTTPPLVGGCGHLPGDCLGETVSRSTDEGATWTTSTAVAFDDNPTGLGFVAGDVDNRLYVDHATGRLFYYDYNSDKHAHPDACGNGRGATIFFSDDSGVTWSHGFSLDHMCTENPTVVVGKRRISSPSPSYAGGVVYLCGNNFGTGIAGGGSTGKVCAKSVDGGLTWVGQLFQNDALTAVPITNGQGCYAGQCKDNFNPYPECAAGGSSSGGNDVQPLPDGTLLIPITCGSRTYLSQSKDEGDTWTIKNRIPHGGTLRSDSVGNLFKLNGTLLSTSTNRGVTWSAQIDMIAPGVGSPGSTHFAIGTHRVGHEVGRVAINYYGVRDGETYSDGFITETRNALDPNPVFWSGQVNHRADQGPLLYNVTPPVNMGVTVLDFTGSAFSPDGRSVWASFVRDCGDSLVTDPNCSSRYPETNPGNPQDGFAGRLVWPPQ